MATRPVTAHQDAQEGAGILNRPRLTVLAADMVDLVSSTGGWLYDRARAGWTVHALADRSPEVRPLTILGATPVFADATSVLETTAGGALAVSAELLRRDAGLREQVLGLWNTGAAEVTVWGRSWPEELGRRVEPEQHRLSVAARAFKARALVAAQAAHRDVAATETVFDLGSEAFRPLYPV
ncbi:hypothetical protein H7I53_16815 [Mycolicibacterium pulveris]|uniref:Uncharacterized protein n=1 Tax=Mycolicibacterium pulveris TaxID=36813 RepID=A0A7I7UCS3_MYCPV|nr:hypothetical protein [Mycolicibacterium pulveris]MCV6981878.1 hypothetical protein [Mycolicibacterium pulveris]BBY79122.1 hypothetical protein MPUL_02800 [Mycolicibacterium pulveris]